tara:strand:- start:2592 stop:3632 length:1041 start_codon:yes stop_codon:yes gene_type:complete
LSTIYKRNGWWWYTQGTPPDRIRKPLKTKNQAVAEKIQVKWDEELALRKAGISIPTINIQKPYRDYLDQIESNKGLKTAQGIKSVLNMFLKLSGDHITNKHLTPLFMQEYMSKRKAMGRSPKTINEDHKILGSWFDYMNIMGMLKDNPLDGLIRPKLEKVNPNRAYNKDEIKAVFNQVYLEHDRIFWNILYKTGLRAVDACTLTPNNINGKFIELKQQKTEEYHKPRKVVIPIHKDLTNLNIFNVIKPGSIGNSRERLKRIIHTTFHPYTKNLNIEKMNKEIRNCQLFHGNLHTFRHSFASHLEELGATRWDTKCLMGHKADDITAQYVKINVKRIAPIINKLGYN